MESNELKIFGTKYSEAWCSQKPESVASFFKEEGSLRVNENKAAVGRAAITKVAEGFMTAFPDMIVTMDSLKVTSDGTEFHWTLTGSNSGPDGTGKKVKVSGCEIWKFDNEGLILESKGSFDAEEYSRQLISGYE
jgi:predicted ester cyclase